jgi:hypothetical protein
MFSVLVFVYDDSSRVLVEILTLVFAFCFYSTLKIVDCCNCNPNNKCSSAISEITITANSTINAARQYMITTNGIGGPKSLELYYLQWSPPLFF